MNKWNYQTTKKSSNGYEEVLNELKCYTKQRYQASNDEQKERMIDEVFDIYRSKNIFPITYYNNEGIKSEIKKCIDKEVKFDGQVLDFKFNQGGALCKFLFPNLHKVECKNATNNSMYERFYNDHKLKRAIKLSLSIKKSVSPSEVRSSLELIGGNVATNFKPMNAKALFEYYTPENGVIYDFASGFGGRMLGALSSKKNFKYIGVEPCSETFENLQTLGKHIESVTGRTNSYEIFKVGSEEFKYGQEECVDFAFSSPPYFNLERYSSEETQCYNKYSDIETWLEGYVRPTIKNIYKLLKKEGKYAVNIADFKVGNKQVKFVDEWIRISEEEGFKFENTIAMKLTARKGEGHGSDKKEGIFVFSK